MDAQNGQGYCIAQRIVGDLTCNPPWQDAFTVMPAGWHHFLGLTAMAWRRCLEAITAGNGFVHDSTGPGAIVNAGTMESDQHQSTVDGW